MLISVDCTDIVKPVINDNNVKNIKQFYQNIKQCIRYTWVTHGTKTAEQKQWNKNGLGDPQTLGSGGPKCKFKKVSKTKMWNKHSRIKLVGTVKRSLVAPFDIGWWDPKFYSAHFYSTVFFPQPLFCCDLFTLTIEGPPLPKTQGSPPIFIMLTFILHFFVSQFLFCCDPLHLHLGGSAQPNIWGSPTIFIPLTSCSTVFVLLFLFYSTDLFCTCTWGPQFVFHCSTVFVRNYFETDILIDFQFYKEV